MADTGSFADLMKRIRAGEHEAAEELVRRYEPLVRREIRLRLEDKRLGRLFDSMDVCQSVLASFCARAGAGQFDLEGPEQLVGLLKRMVLNKVASAARQQHRQKRDQRRQTEQDTPGLEVAGKDPTPSEAVAGAEMLREFRRRLSEEERALADLRAQGLGWDEIAQRLGGKAQARRMQLVRAVNRVGRELGLDEVDDE